MPQFLVLGTSKDPHVSRVVDVLRETHGLACSVLDWRASVDGSLTMSSDGRYDVVVAGERIGSSTVIWDRVKIIKGVPEVWFSDDHDERSSDWRAKEWASYLRLITAMYPSQVFNSLDSKKCQLKPYQQKIASGAGLRVPATLVTNQKAAALEFTSRAPCIVKSLSGAHVIPKEHEAKVPYHVMTMPLGPNAIRDAEEERIACCPLFIQEEVKKDYELRVVVVGRQIHAFKILSQEREVTRLDWRRGILGVRYEPMTLHPDLCRLLRVFMSRMGFFTGSIDLIVDKTGEAWFLECNQDGAWAWLDDRVDRAVSRGFAEEFAFLQRNLQSASVETLGKAGNF